jgi:hypothetical protein
VRVEREKTARRLNQEKALKAVDWKKHRRREFCPRGERSEGEDELSKKKVFRPKNEGNKISEHASAVLDASKAKTTRKPKQQRGSRNRDEECGAMSQ